MRHSRPGGRCTRIPPRLYLAIPFALVFAALVEWSPSSAGVLEAELQTDLDGSEPGELHSAIFVLADAVDTDALVLSLSRLRLSRPSMHAAVIDELRNNAEATQVDFLEEVGLLRAAGEVTGFTPYWITNAVVVEGTRRALDRLTQHRSVVRVEKNRTPILIDPLDVRVVSPTPNHEATLAHHEAPTAQPGIIAIQVRRVWNELHLTGEGTLVACLDTGVDGAHPALNTRWRGHRADPGAAWLNVLDPQSTFPFDIHGHGTHVMGTMAGLDPSARDSIGIAYEAEWIAANAVSPQVALPRFSNAVLASFQWLADPDGDPGTADDVPDVVQNSWGVTPAEGFGICESSWWNAIDACEAAGVVVTFSAGNDGPIAYSIISPADRATTPFKNFSIGAVKATNEEWPFPIATFSSRGPSGCAPRTAIKPEIVAPGVEVYSAWAGSGSYAFASGTSMAGPHVAGVVALMRQANPDLPVDDVKRILMETARPYGPEDDEYGAGLVDAFAAVVAAVAQDGSGRLDGSILGPANEPVPHAEVHVVETEQSFLTGSNGRFLGFVPHGEYTVEFSHPWLETQTLTGIDVSPESPTDLSVQLLDRVGPLVQSLTAIQSLATLDDPLRVRLDLAEYGVVQSAYLHYRRGSSWVQLPMVASPERAGLYEVEWNAVAFGDSIGFFVESQDGEGNRSVYPPGGANAPLLVRVEQRVFADDAEAERGWSLSSVGDTGYGRWVRIDPFGTSNFGTPVEPTDDHSDEGTQCFVTGKGRADDEPDRSDVDDGCVTLTSPVFDVSESGEVTLEYWRWFALDGRVRDGSFRVEASADSGATWVVMEEIDESVPEWTKVSLALDARVDPSEKTLVRFIACDTGGASYVEAAVDDIELRTLPRVEPITPVPLQVRFAIFPNPMRDSVTLAVPAAPGSEVRVEILDPAGRRLQSLLGHADAQNQATLRWDGRDARGDAVPPGVVFYRIDVAGRKTTGKLLVLR